MSFQPKHRVLILYADTGSGHRSVALAIDSALRTMTAMRRRFVASEPVPTAAPAGNEDAIHVSLYHPGLHHARANPLRAYGPITRLAPQLYAAMYHVTNSPRAGDMAGWLVCRLMQRQLAQAIETTSPSLIVSVHSLLTQAATRVLEHRPCNIPLLSVVTDLASIHQSWIAPTVEQCFVPSASVRDDMASRGMPRERLTVTGLPIHPKFGVEADHAERELLRLALGLRRDLFTVLIMGGGEGIGGLENTAHRLAESGLPLQLIAVAGHDRLLHRRLKKQQQAWRVPHRVFGFVRSISDLMRAADVIVTKAGSVTIAESLACGLPIIVTRVIPGQETGNVELLERSGVGCLARHSHEVVREVQRLHTLPDHEMAEIRARALRLSTPDAAFNVADQIVAMLEQREATHREFAPFASQLAPT